MVKSGLEKIKVSKRLGVWVVVLFWGVWEGFLLLEVWFFRKLFEVGV